jgi:hypothetical protein
MSDDFDDDLDEDIEDLDDEELEDAAIEDEDLDADIEGPEEELAVGTAADVVVAGTGDDAETDDDVMEIDDELHPDDVEAPLDALLQERVASTAIDDEEEEIFDEDDTGDDDRGDGPTKIVPRRPGEFLCSSCFLVMPRHMLADEAASICRDCA